MEAHGWFSMTQFIHVFFYCHFQSISVAVVNHYHNGFKSFVIPSFY